jgi:hypothetical protein
MLRAVPPDSKSSDREASSRRVLTAALLGSLLIHLGLGLLFLHFSKPVASKRTPPSSAGIEIEVQRSPELVPVAPEKPLEPARSEKPRVVGGSTRGATNQRAKIVRGHQAAAEPSPNNGDVPRQLDLTLHGPIATASPGGKTTRNLPSEVEEVRKSVAQSRINEWIDDDSASRRVEKGQVDDWFAGLHRALDHALNQHPPPASLAPSTAIALLRQYGDSAARYGATGSPNEPGGTPGAPTSPGPDRGPLAGALGPPHTFALQTEGSASDLWAVVELSYDLEGKLRGSRLLRSSGSREFNLHVLNVVALGLPGLPAMPDGGEGIHPNGTRSIWQVRGHVTFERDMSELSLKNDAWYLPVAAATSLLTGHFDETTGYVGYQDLRKPHLRCEVELLQVY